MKRSETFDQQCTLENYKSRVRVASARPDRIIGPIPRNALSAGAVRISG